MILESQYEHYRENFYILYTIKSEKFYELKKYSNMKAKKKEITTLYPKMLKQLFEDDGVPQRTGMANKHNYVCIAIAVGKPKVGPNGEIEQKYIRRYLPRDISDLIRAIKSLK